MAMKLLVLHGPNLNLLGEHEGSLPGGTLADLDALIRKTATRLGLEVKILQSNTEGVLVDAMHEARRWADGIVLNPGALAHSSYVLREAIAGVNKPTLEVHLTDIRRRESWRRKSVVKDVCEAQVMGKGFESYVIALERFADGDLQGRRRKPKASAKAAAAKVPAAKTRASIPAKPTKTLGRRVVAEAIKTAEPVKSSPSAPGSDGRAPAKTIGARPASRSASPSSGFLTRALVRQKIADRLSGKLTPAGLATWSRSQYLEVQRGAPAESGQREVLEDTLQSLTLSAMPASRLSDDQLVELMTQLE